MAEEHRADNPHSLGTKKQLTHESCSHIADREQQLTPPSTQPVSLSASRSSRSLRTCNANKSKLIYDLKYHPMDESLQPHRASKRREAHGEFFDSFQESESEDCATGVESEGESDSDSNASLAGQAKGEKMTGKGKKRSIEKVLRSEGTRRSARTTKASNVLYDMKVHPQDAAIELSSGEESEGSEEEEGEPVSKKAKTTVESIRISSDSVHESEENVEALESSGDEGQASLEASVQEQAVAPAKSTLISLAVEREASTEVAHHEDVPVEKSSTPEPSPPSNQELALSNLAGKPFNIHSDSLSDHLAAEAQSKSPLKYEHDDQENNMEHQDSQGAQGARNASLSQLMQELEEETQGIQQVALVEKAFYEDTTAYNNPYGFAALDGSNHR